MTISLSPNALVVLERRYLKKDRKGSPAETPQDLFKRVARSVAAADARFDPKADIQKTEQVFYKLMAELVFIPNSPTLMNAGRRLGQLAACFVLPIEDSIDSIFETLRHTAMIHKSGGGTGFSFSRIRPKNDAVLSTRGISSGPISFMTVFDIATETVKQGGTRRGANMGILRVDHPDIEDFIQIKTDLTELNNFNISVALTPSFMEALAADKDYDLINPRNHKVVKRVSAKAIFHKIVRSAWRCGEPGIIFLDHINRANPTPELGEIEATNPCGEQPLLPYESCNLGSINLSKMTNSGKLNRTKLRETVRSAVHFLDNVIEINKYPLRQIEAASKQTRKIGLGVMGFADMLIKMGIAYDSKRAVRQAEQVMAFISREARKASSELAKKRGNFPAYRGSLFDHPKTPYMRNATVTTIAPTGTISIIAGCSSGVEPIFAVVYERRVLDGEALFEIHPLFKEMAKQNGFYSNELAKQIAETGSIQHIKGIPNKIKRLFVTAHDIAPEWHIRIQAAFQKYTDNAVSKTVNFPHNATPEDIEKAYRLAYETGCKGVTIYRYGSRDRQVLNIGREQTRHDRGIKTEPIRPGIVPRVRPVQTRGVTERINTGCGKLYVTINEDDQGICEVFAQMGKTGGCASSQIEATGRLISLALRSGVKVEAILKQISGIRCPSPIWQNGKMVLSCPDGIAHVIKNYTRISPTEMPTMMGACPDCGGALEHEGGCLVCRSCGFSKCS
ncbi:MAG: vitamin B12-dependent ribonucleotide reductase [Deltaproteobacteria bacterium]|nr:vitamin B12-dependent ribonucleotide reductase [Deltaproteobacteria bacterium]MBW2019388.1 vitamin B12-dependent ribonucleotide reductase [Deltaproteobacteria bacterium]MBW2074225.1 vitamin B12-dependent ribonucleotide reductase [Deltaproteobacteria bacterium]RLB83906.1 MAG: ribonucleotide-diphosphate reductase subunit alpha [Deltaproteobacteria bacterium]